MTEAKMGIPVRTFWQDLRFGLRLLERNRPVAFVAVLTLALGTAATTTVFSWMDALLFRPLPGVAEGQGLLLFESQEPAGEGRNISHADYRDYAERVRSATFALSHSALVSYGEGGRAVRASAEFVTGGYFRLLGVRPVLGRLFESDDAGDSLGMHPVTVLSERFWREQMQADPHIVGKDMQVNALRLTVIGIAAGEFRGSAQARLTNLWVPLSMAPQLRVVGREAFENRKMRMLRGLARLRPGAALAQARSEIAAVASRLAIEYPGTNEGFGATLQTPLERNALRRPLQVLMAMCLVVLLITSANVANLLLARAAARQQEISVRLAMGASKGRIIRQLLTESAILAVLGALASVPLAMYAVRLVRYFAPPVMGAPLGVEFVLRWQDFVFAMLVCTAAALLAGLAPALPVGGGQLSQNLREGGRSRMTGTRARRLRGMLVSGETALAFVALSGAGLFLRSLWEARDLPLGFDTRHVLVARIYTSAAGYAAADREEFSRRLRARLESAPGLTGAAYADTIPLGFGLGPGGFLEVEGYLPQRGENMTVSRSLVSPGYFRLLGIRVEEGRDFSELDTRESAPVVIVNRTFATRYFAGANPIGRRVKQAEQWATVVGLVADSKYYFPVETPRPYFFVPSRQADLPAEVAFYLRASGNPRSAIGALRREVMAADPALRAFDAMPLEDYVRAPLFPQRLAAGLLSALGGLALVLTALGIYAVMTYTVNQRMPEFGIRMALGAQRSDLLRLVIGNAMRLTLIGLAAGIVCALAAGRVVRSALIQVSPTDPWAFAGAAAFLGAVALIACLLPALRATRVDPVTALHYQ